MHIPYPRVRKKITPHKTWGLLGLEACQLLELQAQAPIFTIKENCTFNHRGLLETSETINIYASRTTQERNGTKHNPCRLREPKDKTSKF